MGPLPLHWQGTGWWCFGHSMVVLLLLIFVFFCYHIVSTVIIWPYLVLYRFAPKFPFAYTCLLWRKVWAYWTCPTFAFFGPMGLPAAIFCQTDPLGLISFPSFFWAFTALCLYHYSLIFSFISLLLIIGLFCC